MIYLDEIKRIIQENKFESLDNSVTALEEIIQQGQVIDIAVLGQFKAGKSSFINSLFDISIMPVGVIPVTSVITRLQYGEMELARVRFTDGHELITNVRTIEDFISENHNPENAKQVYMVDVELPQLSEYKNLRIIDTPGIGSVYQHNTETAENWFSRIGIAIIAISAERPLAENDISLIQEMEKHSPQTLILLTKTDLFSNGQVDEITTYIKGSLTKHLQKEFQIIGYSIKNNQIFKEQILKQVIEPIAKGSDEKYRQIISHKFHSLTQSCLALLEISYRAAKNSEEENSRLRKIILDAQTNLPFILKELSLIARSQKETTRETIYNIVVKHQREISTRLTGNFETAYKGWKGNLYALARHYENWMKEEMTNEIKRVAETEHLKIASISEKSRAHFEFYLRSFSKRLTKNIEKALGIKVPQQEWQIEIKQIGQPDIAISWAFDSHIDLFWFLFPMFIFKNVFRQYFIRQIPQEAEKNIYRLTADLTDLINASIEKYQEESLRIITSEIYTVNSILSATKSNGEMINNQIHLVKALYSKNLMHPV